MKLLLFTSRFYPHKGGVEKVVELLADNINANKLLITTLDDRKTSLKHIRSNLEVVSEVKNPKYQHFRVWMGLPASLFGYIAFPYRFIASLFNLVRIIKKFKPDIVNYHFPDDTLIYFLKVSYFFRFKYVVNIHGNDLQLYSRKKLYKPLFTFLFWRASKIVVNSYYMRDEMSEKYPKYSDKVVIIPNSIDTENIESYPSKKMIDKDYIFFVGRMVHKKGVDILLQAFSKVQISNLDLVIEGSGEEHEKMKQLSKKLGIDEKVHFTNGLLSEAEKFSYMKGALLGVVPSRIEPFGIVALEYMAAEVPVIASKTGGLEKIIADGETGIFFENGNINELAEKIRLMVQDNELRLKLKNNGLQNIHKYDNQHILAEYLKLYESVAK